MGVRMVMVSAAALGLLGAAPAPETRSFTADPDRLPRRQPYRHLQDPAARAGGRDHPLRSGPHDLPADPKAAGYAALETGAERRQLRGDHARPLLRDRRR